MTEHQTSGRGAVLGLCLTFFLRSGTKLVRWRKVVLQLREHLVYMWLYDTKARERGLLVDPQPHQPLSVQYELQL